MSGIKEGLFKSNVKQYDGGLQAAPPAPRPAAAVVYSELQMKEALYSMASILWDLLPYETKEQLGCKADWVLNYYHDNIKPKP